MDPPHGYKDEKHEKMAQEVRQAIYEQIKHRKFQKYTKQELQEIVNAGVRKSNYLAKYLKTTYPESFNVKKFRYNGKVPVIEEKSQNLEEAPKIVQDIWRTVITENNYKPKIHDLIYVKITQRNITWVYFVDDGGIYVQTNSDIIFVPDEFDDFLERMGIHSVSLYHLYPGYNHTNKFDNWPDNVNQMKKI